MTDLFGSSPQPIFSPIPAVSLFSDTPIVTASTAPEQLPAQLPAVPVTAAPDSSTATAELPLPQTAADTAGSTELAPGSISTRSSTTASTAPATTTVAPAPASVTTTASDDELDASQFEMAPRQPQQD